MAGRAGAAERTDVEETIARLRPMLAVSGERAQVTTGHRYELKWDGVRVLASIGADGRMTLRSRTGNDVTPAYPELADLAARVAGPTVLDGEVVAFAPDGAASFGVLQRRMHLRDPTRVAQARREVPVHLVLYDVLVDAGEATLRAPLEERRGRLEAAGLHGGAVQVPPASDDLDAMLAVARSRGEEGVVAKRRGSPYRPGVRSQDWVKLPFTQRCEVVVVGWRPERGGAARTRDGGRLGAVLVGAHDAEGRMRYLGAVGSGLGGRAGEQLRATLRSAQTWTSTDPVPHDDARPVLPQVVGTVRHRGLTTDGRLRQPVWLGRRDDVDPAEVHLDDVVSADRLL